MKNFKSFTAFIVALFASVYAAFEFGGIELVPSLELCVEWVKGFTAHTDGVGALLLANTVPAVVAGNENDPDPDPEGDGSERNVPVMMTVNPDDFGAAMERAVTAAITAQQNTPNEPPVEIVREVRGNRIFVRAQRDVDGPDGELVQTKRLFDAVASRNFAQQSRTLDLMSRAGLYDEHATSRWEGDERAVHLTSAEGAPFLPTTVDSRIEEIREELGIMRGMCSIYNFNSGSHKIPNTTGRPEVFAVNEGAMIRSRKAVFGEGTLDPKKWGIITAWSTEMSDEVGVQFVNKIVEQVGRSFAEAEDKTVLVADGSATYHSITGLLNLAGVGEFVMNSGDTNFDNMTYEDGLDLMLSVPVGARRLGSTHVFHQDFELIWAKFKDTAGQYIYPPNSEITRLVRPARFTEVMPARTDSAADTAFGVFGDFSLVTLGFQRGLNVKLLDQATIQDVDDSTPIHLGSQDMVALRFTSRWDVSIGLPQGFGRIKTAAS